MEKKFTPGEWQLSFVHGFCIGVEVELQPQYSQVIVNTILPDTDEEYEKEKTEILANASLIAAAPNLLKALEDLMNHYETKGNLLSWDVNIARKAISKALNIK